MFTIVLDPGHGAGSASNRGFIGGNEGDYNWDAVQLFIKYAHENYENVKVITTRPRKTDNPELDERGAVAKGSDLFLSWHTNAFNGKASGVEVYDDVNPKYSNKKLATEICNKIASILNIGVRGVHYKKLSSGSNYYGVLRAAYAKNNMLLEVCFHDNADEVKKYKDRFEQVVKGVADTIMLHYGVKKKSTSSSSVISVKDVAIMGMQEVTAQQMRDFLVANNPNPKINDPDILHFCQMYLEEGSDEGVRGDIAFCQSLHETGWFKYGGLVLPEQNNYSGIGATNNSEKGKGAWFESPRIGIRAQIQHLKAYASKEKPKVAIVDPRYGLVSKGSATTWQGLNGKWAVPGTTYGQSILKLYEQLKKVPKREIAKPKEDAKVADKKVLDKLIHLGSEIDIKEAVPLAKHINALIAVNGVKRDADEHYIVGGSIPTGLTGKIINLSGRNRFETSRKVEEFINKNKKEV